MTPQTLVFVPDSRPTLHSFYTVPIFNESNDHIKTPSEGLVKDRILCVWEQRRAEMKDRTRAGIASEAGIRAESRVRVDWESLPET